MNNLRLVSFVAAATVAAMLASIGCGPGSGPPANVGDLPQITQQSVQPSSAVAGDWFEVSAVIDTKGVANAEVYLDTFLASPHGASRVESTNCAKNGNIWSCRFTKRINFPGTHYLQWVIFFDPPASPVFTSVQGDRMRVDIAEAPNGTSSPSPGTPTSGQGPGLTSGCFLNPVPSATPDIVGPENGAFCVGRVVPGGPAIAGVDFDFRDVAETCGSGAYQIEIHRVDANCAEVPWTDVGTGLNNIGTCWTADQNQSFHTQQLDRGTRYSWRVRANSNSTSAGAGPWSAFQTFTTGGTPAAPTFVGTILEGSQVHLGDVNVPTNITIQWTSSGCGNETYSMNVFQNNVEVVAARQERVPGVSAVVEVRRDNAYRIELVVHTDWGSSQRVTMNFTTVR